MTREEAIKILKAIRVYECYPKSASEETKEAIDMAIEALSTDAVSREFYEDVLKANHGLAKENCELKEQIESAPSSDLISRADAVKAICDKCLEEHCETECIVPCTFMEALEAVPSAETVPLRSDCADCALKAINQPKLDEESYERGYTAGQFANRPSGKWKCMGDCGVTECDQCGWIIEEYVGDYNFCPNCGADMRGEEHEFSK